MSHWTATARLKLGSPQPIRCCPATVRLPYWVRRAQGTEVPDKWTANSAPGNNKRKPTGKTRKTPALKLGSWNVRTMTPGLSDDLQDISDARKTSVINDELARLQVDIATLQETRLPDSGTLREKDFTFFWQGKSADDIREYGVGFAVRNSLLGMIEPCQQGTERLLSLRLHTTTGPVNLISVYAPTLGATGDTKDEFYGQLDSLIDRIPKEEHLILLGDFNARVGADHDSWPSCLGKFGVGKMNENGQRLLEMCSYHDLSITNSFFQTKPQHKVSWRHPRSKHWHQLDLIITRRSALKGVLLTRTFHSADCDTDHSLVCCKMRLQPKKIHRSRPEGKPRIDVSKTAYPDKAEEFTRALSELLDVEPPGSSAKDRWDYIRETVHSTAMRVFGRKQTKNNDWFEANSAILTPAIEERRSAHLEYKRSPSQRNLQEYRSAKSKVQRLARQCANDYWLQLCQSIQLSADTGNIRGIYDGIKKAMGPTKKITAPLKSATGETIQDKGKQMERWVEHYSELYSRQNQVTDDTLDAIESLPLMAELDEKPTLAELKKAIESLSTGKAPGKDGIPPEIIKCGNSALMEHLHDLLCQCWEEGAVPQDMRDANIVTLYKNKGDRSDCNNYRGISLLSIVGKVFARVILNRLQKLADRVYPESQCGFRAGRSTSDMVFSIRQLQEKCREQHKPLLLAFIDLTKAFDLVSRDGLFKVLAKIGCPPKLLSMIQSFHDGMKGTVQYDGSTSDAFDIRSGVKQGCVLAPTLFGIFFAVLLKHAFGTSTEGVYLHTRSDGRLYNLARLKAKSKVRQATIRDMLFADDAALATHTEPELQCLMDRFAKACDEFGLTISLKKTNVMAQDAEPPRITIQDYELEVVSQFTYLGSTITNNLSLDSELNQRIGKASTTLARLSQRVWNNSMLTMNTKITVYRACVLSTLLYASETWTLYAHQEKRLSVFHMRCLRRILGITWSDRVTNNEVLERAKIPSMVTLLRQRRLRWLGHVCRMDEGRIPKDILYAELASGKRETGRPHLRFKDVCKRDMKALDIDISTWEELAQDRSSWRITLNAGLKAGEVKLRQLADAKRAKRKGKQLQPTAVTAYKCSRCNRDCHSRVGLYSHRRRCTTT